MSVIWNLYRFDYYRFVQLRPYLRSAVDPAEFAALADGPESDAIIEALIEGELTVVEARQAFLIAYCCIGEPLPCPRPFARVFRRLRHDVRTEAAMELLSDAIVGDRNLETWLRPRGKFTGFLTPDEVVTVWQAYQTAGNRDGALGTRRRRVRRGGLLPAAVAFVRRLFDRGLANDDLYRLLGDLLEEAVANTQGIAVIGV